VNEIKRCVCKVDMGYYCNVDKINFDKPVWVRRCTECHGLLEGEYLW